MADIVSTVGSDPSRDYATLTLWQAGRQLVHTDLVADGDTEIAECYDDGDPIETGGFDCFGWFADANNHVIIRAARGHQHDGTAHLPADATGNGAWLTDTGVGAGSEIISMFQPFTFVSGLRLVHSNRPGIMALGNGIQSGRECTFVNILGQGVGATSSFSVGKIQGPNMTNVRFIGCIAIEGGGYNASGFGDNHEMFLINCVGIKNSQTFSAFEFSAPGLVLDIVNCISIQPTSEHIGIVGGSPLISGKANIQDDSGATGTLPDDDPSFPSFTDVPVVFEEDNPGPAAEQLILRRKDLNNVTPLRSEFCLAVGNGAPDVGSEAELDVNGLAIPANRHIGAIIPITAGPHVILVNL